MKRNRASFILSGLMIVLLIACGESGANPRVLPEMVTLDGVTYTVIAEESDFEKVRSDLTGNYYLWRDIALSTDDFDPIGDDSDPFTGIFDGGGYTISKLRIAKSGEDYVGFFGQIGADGDFDPANPNANGVVRNLTLVLVAGNENNLSVEGANHVGALAGESYGKIEAVGVEGGFVKGTSKYVGGLVGGSNGTITSSYATGSVSGSFDYVGGLVGRAQRESRITSSYATGSVSGSFDYVGGLVGINAHPATIEESYATGSVTLTGTGSNVGGLVGATGGTINSSYFDRSIENNFLGTDITPSTEIIAGGREPFETSGNWDFAAVWAAQGDGQWPLLAWQLEQ